MNFKMLVHVFNNSRRILSENIKHKLITAAYFFSYISSVNLFILISCHLCPNEKDNFDMKIVCIDSLSFHATHLVMVTMMDLD